MFYNIHHHHPLSANLFVSRTREQVQGKKESATLYKMAFGFYGVLANFCLLSSLNLLRASIAFQSQHPAFVRTRANRHHAVSSPSRLQSTASPSSQPTLTPQQQQRRSTLLGRNGPYFRLDRFNGRVEFGSTADLVTQLERNGANQDGVAAWLSDERRVALSIWDEALTKEMGDNVYRLQVMELRFVTLQLAPTVDCKMWTRNDASDDGSPVFSLQSVSFDPRLQILPGIQVSAQSLGIVIEVVGELRPTQDGMGVTGRITFQTSGELPPPMRILPEAVLKAASDTINETVSRFAVQSFQRGATAKYADFRRASSAASDIAQRPQQDSS